MTTTVRQLRADAAGSAPVSQTEGPVRPAARRGRPASLLRARRRRSRALLGAMLVWLVSLLPSMVQAQTPEERVATVRADSRVRKAEEHLKQNHDRWIEETIQITEIAAPPFKEAARARAYLEMLRKAGLTDTEMDPEGNVMGVRKGTGGGPLLAITAHLDTVFPEGTDVRVRREGTRLRAPGVGDNSRSLALLLALIRALDSAGIRTAGDLLFVGDVGEEGTGDLRGIKYLLQKGRYRGRIGALLAIDGTGFDSLTTGALGSRRYKVVFRGPGGHSYAAFGMVNPAYALARAIAQLSALDVPSAPRTTVNVGVLGGGTSVNSIPSEAWMEIDLRSESPTILAQISEKALALMRQAADEENRARSTIQGKVEVETSLIGNRPSGTAAEDSPLVRTCDAAFRSFGLSPQHRIGSTDANVPISMGIQAVTLASGASGGRGHSLDEWIDVEPTASLRGAQILLTVVLSVSGMR